MPADLFTRAEAAVLAEAPPSAIDKAIEEGVMEIRKVSTRGKVRARRFLPTKSVYYIVFLKKCAVHFSKNDKRIIWKRLKATSAKHLLTVEWSLSPGVKIKPGEVLGPTLKRVARYSKARDQWIHTDDEIKGGTPVIRGTRMSVYSVAGRVTHGETIDDIHKDNPDLHREALEAAVDYAKANPLVGRPGGRPWQA